MIQNDWEKATTNEEWKAFEFSSGCRLGHRRPFPSALSSQPLLSRAREPPPAMVCVLDLHPYEHMISAYIDLENRKRTWKRLIVSGGALRVASRRWREACWVRVRARDATGRVGSAVAPRQAARSSWSTSCFSSGWRCAAACMCCRQLTCRPARWRPRSCRVARACCGCAKRTPFSCRDGRTPDCWATRSYR